MIDAILRCLGYRKPEQPRPQISKPFNLQRPYSVHEPRMAPPEPAGSTGDVQQAIDKLLERQRKRQGSIFDEGDTFSLVLPERRLSGIPESVTPDDEPLPRLSYDQKGKWKAGAPPPVRPLDLPDSEQVSVESGSSGASSESSKYSTYYG